MTCKNCKKHGISCTGGRACQIICKQEHMREPITNADNIRVKADEALAELFFGYGYCPPWRKSEPCKFNDCKKCWLDWLKEEVKA